MAKAPEFEAFSRRLRYQDGKLIWAEKPSTHVHVGDEAGCVDVHGYRIVRVFGRNYKAHRVIWLLVTGDWPAQHIDHIDGDTLNNKTENLREVSRSQNMSNAKLHRDSRSGLKGVSWNKSARRWRASIAIGGTQKHLGSFLSAEEAHAAYRKAADLAAGQFARFG